MLAITTDVCRKIAMAGYSATFDIIFLFGPDLAVNKFDCLPSSFLSGNAEIICPDELYNENPEYGLRDIALRVILALKQKKQVVINDELRSRSTRESLLDTVRKKVLSCRVLLVQVIPKYGFLQVMWLQQLSHAIGDNTTNSKDEEYLRRWFDESTQNIDYSSGFVDEPNEKEGYSVEMLFVPLRVTSLFKLEFPALFFQWEAVLNEKEEFSSQVEVLCGHWITQNPCGRIIFIHEERKVTKDILQQANESNSFIRCLKQLSLKIKHPVYSIQIGTALCSGSFYVPPQPGILAFLHVHHLLNLQSKNTCYIFRDVNHMRMAEAAGVKYVKISALKSPDMVLNGQGVVPCVPGLLRNMVVKKPDPKYRNQLPQIPTVPLFDYRHEIKDGHVSHKFENGLTENVFVKDIQSFCHYQEEFSHHVTPTDHPGSKLIGICPAEPSETINKEKVSADSTRSSNKDNSGINIPHWMRKRKSRYGSDDERCISDQLRSARPSSAKNNRSAQTVYVMSEKEAVEMARQLLLQANHEDIITAANNHAQGDNPG